MAAIFLILLVGDILGGMIYYNYGYRMDPVTEPKSGKDTIHLMIATDLHYLSASLTDRGDAWQDISTESSPVYEWGARKTETSTSSTPSTVPYFRV